MEPILLMQLQRALLSEAVRRQTESPLLAADRPDLVAELRSAISLLDGEAQPAVRSADLSRTLVAAYNEMPAGNTLVFAHTPARTGITLRTDHEGRVCPCRSRA